MLAFRKTTTIFFLQKCIKAALLFMLKKLKEALPHRWVGQAGSGQMLRRCVLTAFEPRSALAEQMGPKDERAH